MKCPHCKFASQQPVKATRKHGDEVYRLRNCQACGNDFHTVESAPVGLRMPAGIYHRDRGGAAGAASDGRELAGAWK